MGIELNEQQVFAVYDMEHWYKNQSKQVFEVSGPAGSGKTTIIMYMMERLGIDLKNVLFVAYMGKAASVMIRNGLPAKTIHSSIYTYKKVPEYDEDGHKIRNADGTVKMTLQKFLKPSIGKHIKLIVLDEGSTVNKEIAEDLLSFGIPVIVLGDLNQLPPVFGNPYFLNKPDVILTKVMRQAEGNPIIWLSQEVLADHRLRTGVYGHSAVVNRHDLNEFNFKQADICLTGTNDLRYATNCFYREALHNIDALDYPHVKEKVICRKNNWALSIDDCFLTNGTTGIVTHIDKSSCNGKTMVMDFKPDFSKTAFKDIKFDYRHINAKPHEEESSYANLNPDVNKMEYAYAITVHSSQGSQWDNILFMAEKMLGNRDDHKKFLYTGITRAAEVITIAL